MISTRSEFVSLYLDLKEKQARKRGPIETLKARSEIIDEREIINECLSALNGLSTTLFPSNGV